MLPVWALIPPFLSGQGDRIFYHQLKSFGLELRQIDRPTVNYVTRAPGIYHAAGLPPPAAPRVLYFQRGQRILHDPDPRMVS